MAFHDVRFPIGISLGAQGGPERRTDVVVLGSGYEQRNSRWADSRRSYNAGYGVRSLDDLHQVIEFFEERRGRLFGFRWRDHTDWKSCEPGHLTGALDQVIGTGDAATVSFDLVKTYGSTYAPWTRRIRKPVVGSIKVAVDGVEQIEASDFITDAVTGSIVFQPARVPAIGASVTAGFEFDVPVRFDTDMLEINIQGFRAGAIPSIPIVEIRL
ncbi:MAG: DUF2460 domain-containing protein [Alphaproteobacteria bacterium]|nr:DUF2460 domain-containing protein [Alphaproteobacteria bacterium]